MAEITIADATPRVQYSVGATPTTGPWTIPWPYYADGDIKVYFDDTLQTITTDYTISGTAVDDGYSGGTITAVSNQSNITVTIVRDIPIERTTDFPVGPFNIKTLNKELDKLFAIAQQLAETQDRIIQLSETSSSGVSAVLPDPTADYVLSWNSGGTALENKQASDFTGPTGPTGPAGADGDMTGPVSSTDNALARFNGTSGGTVDDSAWLLNDSDVLDAQNNQLKQVLLLDYGEVTNAIGSIGGGTQDIDLTLGNSVSGTVDTSTTTFTFSNPPASDELGGFVLALTDGGSQTINWPASVDWAGGTVPTLTASGVDWLVFWTIDGGTIWNGGLVGAAFA